ncbi:hypothetical protein LUZ63_011268 [Rhynchospora breviuscula]|uniref:Uncharacterized protein n=1 Tax=Rhynchospora breviuscula TaxID=2022672 RepID=A0A9Q0CIN7_9POAL|nr:hypothetical protein LUZ63_011268 [Rhynchospora breviuscula]
METDSRCKSSSNLERFLSCVTPSVPLYSLSKDSFKDPNCLFQRDGGEIVECFALEDLWDWYAECSAYGLGVPVGLNTGDCVVQYYVPYLSALQIYTSKSPIISRNNGATEESESDWWSDDSAASEKLSKSWDDVSVSDDTTYEPEISPKDRFGNLYFHFVEWNSPYQRTPLFDKINELSRDHPGLMSFKSAEVSPASWMSIAWYPIYHIPARGNSKEMATCFLTYHTISSLFQDCTLDEKDVLNGGGLTGAPTKAKWKKHTTLSPFGLVTYKMQGNVWRDPEASRTIGTLYSAADSWLRQLGVHHHDFNFFTNHSCK